MRPLYQFFIEDYLSDMITLQQGVLGSQFPVTWGFVRHASIITITGKWDHSRKYLRLFYDNQIRYTDYQNMSYFPFCPAMVNDSSSWWVICVPRVGWMTSSQRKKPTFGGVGRSNLK